MLKAGYYPQPLLRTTTVQAPIVAGYATVRLQAHLQFSGTGAGTYTGTLPALVDNSVLGVFENTGATTVAVQLIQTGDYTSGPRLQIGDAFSLVAGGRHSLSFTPQMQFVELWGSSGGPSTIRAQLSSQVEWSVLGFSRTDTTYPTQLYQPIAYLQGS
jgi:hypothetical protein